MIQRLFVMKLFIDVDAKLCLKDNDDETKTIPTIFNEKKVTCKTESFYIFTCIFINYYSIIHSC